MCLKSKWITLGLHVELFRIYMETRLKVFYFPWSRLRSGSGTPSCPIFWNFRLYWNFLEILKTLFHSRWFQKHRDQFARNFFRIDMTILKGFLFHQVSIRLIFSWSKQSKSQDQSETNYYHCKNVIKDFLVNSIGYEILLFEKQTNGGSYSTGPVA